MGSPEIYFMIGQRFQRTTLAAAATYQKPPKSDTGPAAAQWPQ
jgi:hypothetical protein